MRHYLFLIILQVFSFRVSASSAKSAEYATDQLIIGIPRAQDASQIHWERLGLRLVQKLGPIPYYLVKITDLTGVEDKKKQLEKSSNKLGIQSIEFDHINEALSLYTPQPFPNDPKYQDGDGKFNAWLTQADLAWNETLGQMNIWSYGGGIASPVAIVDTGIYSSHEEFPGRLLVGWNVLLNSIDTSDTHGHGTQVSGICGAAGNNGKGISGFLGNQKMIPVKVANSSFALNSDLILGINWAASNGAKVISISLAGSGASVAVQAACDNAFASGCVLVAGSGNSGTNVLNYPASYSSVISVGASDSQDGWPNYSTYSSALGLVATGGSSTLGTYDQTTTIGSPASYISVIGTSGTAPIVSALASILLSNGVVWYECVSRMARTADKIDPGTFPYATVTGHPLGTWNDHFGYGRINFFRAMKTLVPPTLNVPIATVSQVDLTYIAPPLSDSGISGYNIYRSSAAGGPYTKINGSLVAGTSYTDTGVISGQVWYYVVRGIDSNLEGFETKPSNEQSMTVPYPSPTVTPTWTVSPTCTITPSVTFTSTFSPSFTITPTITATPTITITFSTTATPVARPAAEGELFVAPQPANGKCWVMFRGAGSTARIRIFNGRGELAWKGEAGTRKGGTERIQVDIQGWAWGVYLATVDEDGHKLGPARFMVGK